MVLQGKWLHAAGPFAPLTVPPMQKMAARKRRLAGIYIVGEDGTPYRIGMAIGNEFSDHQFEKRNYLNLAGSKLRTCSVGPELVVGAEFRVDYRRGSHRARTQKRSGQRTSRQAKKICVTVSPIWSIIISNLKVTVSRAMCMCTSLAPTL